jgi:predicted transcriptional regulator of viral defense system
VLDHDYLIRHVSTPDMQWGMKTEWHAEIRLRFADPARTVIDILDAPALGGGIRHCAEIVASYLDDHDPALLVEYGDRLGNRAMFKRLGYITEAIGAGHADLVAACRDRVSAGISPLDPDGPEGGRRVMRWGLRVNIRIEPEEPA